MNFPDNPIHLELKVKQMCFIFVKSKKVIVVQELNKTYR